jgi:hypothetical protein
LNVFGLPYAALPGANRSRHLAREPIDRRLFRREDILINHDYVDLIGDVDGTIHLDLGKFHDAVPITAGWGPDPKSATAGTLASA